MGTVTTPTTPQGLWQSACRYFLWCDTHPIIAKRTVMTGVAAGAKVEQEERRPYSVKALCLHCGINEKYLMEIRETKDPSNMYYVTVSKILYVIYIQAYEMAMTGLWNPVFTSKVLNIGEQEDPGGNIKIDIVFSEKPKLARTESEILEKLESEKDLLQLSKEQ